MLIMRKKKNKKLNDNKKFNNNKKEELNDEETFDKVMEEISRAVSDIDDGKKDAAGNETIM